MKARSDGSRGFTLIELLVVIAIIGLLSSVVLASLNGARTKARNARRIADLQQMQTAMELYYNDNNGYPVGTSSLAPTYIASVPTDPGSGSAAYTYVRSSNGNYYCLGAAIEGTVLPVSTCNTTSLGAAAPSGNYVVGP